MLTDHAIVFKGSLKPDQVRYLVLKANKLGLSGRELTSVYSMEDSEGKHIYYETTNPRDCEKFDE